LTVSIGGAEEKLWKTLETPESRGRDVVGREWILTQTTFPRETLLLKGWKPRPPVPD